MVQVKELISLFEIWVSGTGTYWYCSLLGCDDMKFGRWLHTFWRNRLPPSSILWGRWTQKGVSVTSHPSTGKLLHHSSSWYEYNVVCVNKNVYMQVSFFGVFFIRHFLQLPITVIDIEHHRICWFLDSYISSIIDKHQQMHFFAFKTALV